MSFDVRREFRLKGFEAIFTAPNENEFSPALANLRAVASPIPLVAPVIKIICVLLAASGCKASMICDHVKAYDNGPF